MGFLQRFREKTGVYHTQVVGLLLLGDEAPWFKSSTNPLAAVAPSVDASAGGDETLADQHRHRFPFPFSSPLPRRRR